MSEYTPDHARSGVDADLPVIETWPNQYRGYRVEARIDEFTSVCPKTGLPDFAVLTIEYEPDQACFELKSLKMYLLAFRDVGIFQENAVNRIKDDLVEALDPVWLTVKGEFTPRGGIFSTVVAEYRR